jgi:hypothetical protein
LCSSLSDPILRFEKHDDKDREATTEDHADQQNCSYDLKCLDYSVQHRVLSVATSFTDEDPHEPQTSGDGDHEQIQQKVEEPVVPVMAVGVVTVRHCTSLMIENKAKALADDGENEMRGINIFRC